MSAELRVYKGSLDPAEITSPQVPNFTIQLQGSCLVEHSHPKKNENGGCKREDCNPVKELPGALSFGLTTVDGTTYHFQVSDEQELKTWTHLLQFLTVFPHSILPVEPNYSPTGLHDKLYPILYSAGNQALLTCGLLSLWQLQQQLKHFNYSG